MSATIKRREHLKSVRVGYNGFRRGYHARVRIRILASSSIRHLSFSNCLSFETRGRSTLSVLLRLEGGWGGIAGVGEDLALHENGDGINFANVWNESVEVRGSG